ncbi:MAG: SufD family Fe-S cluster assembly protein, partial [Flavobacteriales bacterium]|nr:SufD family Fe-S cluster assembly protein [Flavobacteriales bacterium]
VWIGEGLSADVCLEIISDPRKAHSVLILVVAEKDSRTDLNLIISGSGQIRCNTFVSLAGPAARAHLRSVILSSPSSHHDLHNWVQHRAPETESNQTVRLLGAKDSTSVFSGQIVVENSAPRTTAYQSAKGLLLDEGAFVYMRPFLEIYHDDVKCSHGCTTGFLDPEQLFYLRSRGISESRARQELTEAFVREVFSSVGSVIQREYLNSALKHILNTCL